MNVAVCLPTRNEIASIGLMIKKIKALGYNLFIVDEESTDGTREVARKNGVPVYDREGSGKGWGVKKAMEVARKKGYDVLVLIDCDNTYPVNDIPKLLRHIPEYDMVIGTRDMDNVRPLHRLPNIVHTMAVNILFFARLNDINSGLRAFKVKPLMGTIDAPGFDIEAQITVNSIKRGMKILEIPIHYEKRLGDSKIRAMDGLLILKRIFLERFRRLPPAGAK